MRLMLAVIAVGMVSIAPARADTTDQHTGSSSGIWCGYGVTFGIDSREPGDRWVFDGTIYFANFKQYDRLWIEQYTDNSLRMIRYLSGPGAARCRRSRPTRRRSSKAASDFTPTSRASPRSGSIAKASACISSCGERS